MADFADRQSHLIFVAAVVLKNGKALIGKKGAEETHNAGLWGIPGGKVDQTKGGEEYILEKTVAREVKEETGVTVNLKTMRYAHSDTFIRASGHHVVAILFICNWKSGKAKSLEDTEAVAWIGPKDMKNYSFAGGTKHALNLAFRANIF